MRRPALIPSGYGSWIMLGMVCALALVASLSSAGAQDVFGRIWTSLGVRVTGPLSFRFLLQPAMTAIAATHDGIKDARTGRSPYFWTVLTNPAERAGRLREGLKATSRIIVLALVMDAAFQVLVLKTFHLGEALVIAMTLAFLPYLLIRGPVARAARRWRH